MRNQETDRLIVEDTLVDVLDERARLRISDKYLDWFNSRLSTRGTLMTSIDEALAIARRERLSRWLQVGRPGGTSANRVCVFADGGSWTVVITDERAAVVETSRRRFASEATAVDEALDSARMLRALLSNE